MENQMPGQNPSQPLPSSPSNLPLQGSTPAPASIAGPVQQTPVPAPSMPPTAPATQLINSAPIAVKASFLGGKFGLTLVIAGVIVGSVTLGYVAFPEPFYNTVGKYIGLPAPQELEETSGTESSESEGDKPAAEELSGAENSEKGSISALFEKLPGADANYIVFFQSTDEAKEIIQELLTKAETLYGEDIGKFKKMFTEIQTLQTAGLKEVPQAEKLLEILQSASRIAMVAKIDVNNLQAQRGVFKNMPSEFPFALAIKIPANKENEFLTTVEELKKLAKEEASKSQEQNPFEKFSVGGQGDGLILISNDLPLSGKLSDNPLLGTLGGLEQSNVGFVLDTREIVASAMETLEEELHLSELKLPPEGEIEKIEIIKKVQHVAFGASLKKDSGIGVLSLTVKVGGQDSVSASELISYISPQIQSFTMLLPAEYQTFLTTKLEATENTATLEIQIKDLLGLEEKLLQTFEEQRQAQKKQQEELKRIFKEQEDILKELESEPSSPKKVPRG